MKGQLVGSDDWLNNPVQDQSLIAQNFSQFSRPTLMSNYYNSSFRRYSKHDRCAALFTQLFNYWCC